MIKVRAIEPGFYIGRRPIGMVFDYPKDAKLGKWMEVVESKPEPKRPAKAKPEASKVDESEGS